MVEWSSDMRGGFIVKECKESQINKPVLPAEFLVR